MYSLLVDFGFGFELCFDFDCGLVWNCGFCGWADCFLWDLLFWIVLLVGYCVV